MDGGLKVTREIIVTILFGLATPWLWVAILGLFSAHVEFPLLVMITEKTPDNLGEEFVSNYQFVLGGLGSFLAALLIAVPYGILLRHKQMFFYVIFILLVIGTHILEAYIYYPNNKMYISFFLSSSPYWVFIISSGILVYWISKLQKRKDA